MVSFLTSLREVAPELHAPGLDVLMVGVETLGQAPLALENLEFHVEFSDWRALNLLQVREAAALARVLLDAEQALATFRRALYTVHAASNGVQSAAGKMRLHPSRPARRLGRDALQISAAGFIGSDAQLHEIDNHLVPVRAASAHPTQGAGELLDDMEKALVSLRSANRRLHGALERLDAVEASFQELRLHVKEPLAHALTRASPEIAAAATSFASSLRRLLRVIRDSNASNHVSLLRLVAGRRHDLHARTALPWVFDFRRFSGPLEVRTRRDVAEVLSLSTPHADVSGRRFTVVLRGIDSLFQANTIRDEVDAGVRDFGWRVHGLRSLSTAQTLCNLVDLLDASLTRLLAPDAMDDDGAVRGPHFFNAAEVHATEICRIMSGDPTVPIPELRQLTDDVLGFVVASRGPEDVKNPVRTRVHEAHWVLGLIRGLAVAFVAA